MPRAPVTARQYVYYARGLRVRGKYEIPRHIEVTNVVLSIWRHTPVAPLEQRISTTSIGWRRNAPEQMSQGQFVKRSPAFPLAMD